MIYVFFNPLSNNNKGTFAEKEIAKIFSNKEIEFSDITTLQNIMQKIDTLSEDDQIIIAGGDGTLTRFVNDIYEHKPKQQIYFYPSGSGNDFFNDIKDSCDIVNNLVPLEEYIKSLPEVTVNGITRKFVNGIGIGIDGFCCEEGDKIRGTTNKKVNYTSIALKGLLYKFTPSNAKVTIDGVTKNYKKVWLAPTMLGKYYGGGMKIAPNQNRLNKDNLVTNVVLHNASRLGILFNFSSVFKGTHSKLTKIVDFNIGHEISVEFNKPQALQIDGETIRNVSSYSVKFLRD